MKKNKSKSFCKIYHDLRLKKKAVQYDKVINSLHTEISALKLRLKESESIKRSKSPTHDFQFPQIIEIETCLKLFINQK